MSVNVDIEEAPADLVPKCPYCGERLSKVWMKKRGLGIFGSAAKQFLVCPHCESLLAYGAFHI
jgi:hypothetical protein